jgi:membrane-associated phospholipid phosphatase
VTTPTPRPRLYLGLALACLCVFALAGLLVATDSFVVGIDKTISDAAFAYTHARPTLWDATNFVTDRGVGTAIWVVGTVAVILVALRREFVRALVGGVLLLVSRPVSPWLKGEFGRARPDLGQVFNYESFPSGHTYGTAVVYGALAVALLRLLHGSRWRWVAAGAAWLFILLMAMSRVMVGWHFPSDTIGGASLGLTWGFLWMALVDWWDVRKTRRTAKQAGVS